jgi:hypothetical protein
MTTQDSNTINVTKIIDDSPIRGFQILVFVLCSLAAFLDGIDTQNIGVAAPIIAANMKLTHAVLGPVFSSVLVGATLGALTFGLLGDQCGRKVMLALAAFMFGIFTIATAYAETYEQLLAIRFAAGIGMGGDALLHRIGFRIRADTSPCHGGERCLVGVSLGRLCRRLSERLYPLDIRLAVDLSVRRRAAARDHARFHDLAAGIAKIPYRQGRRNHAHHGDRAALAAQSARQCAIRFQ